MTRLIKRLHPGCHHARGKIHTGRTSSSGGTGAFQYLGEEGGDPRGPPLAAAHYFGGAPGGALLYAVPQIEEAATRPARRRHGAGGESGQRCPDLLLLLPVQFHGVLPLQWA